MALSLNHSSASAKAAGKTRAKAKQRVRTAAKNQRRCERRRCVQKLNALAAAQQALSLALLSHNTRVLAAVWCPSHVRCLCFWGTRKLEVRRPMSCGKAFILCSCTVCSQSPTRGIRRGIRGGSGSKKGDPRHPGPSKTNENRGIHCMQLGLL